MKGVILRRADSRRDLVDIFQGYAREGKLAVARRFLGKAEAAFARLARMPGIGTRFEVESPLVGEIRYLPLASPFKNYVVFYRPLPDGIEVLRVLHGARDIQGILGDDLGIEPGDG